MPTPKPVTSTPLSPQAYKEKVWAHLLEREGFSPRIYSDSKGIPTMGVGYALAVQGSNGTYRLRSWDDIGTAITGDATHPYIFTAAEKQRLHTALDLLNNAKLRAEEKEKLLKANIPVWDLEHRDLSYNYFGFSLSEKRARKIAEYIWQKYRDNILNHVRTKARARRWSTEEVETYVARHFQGSLLELA